MLAVVLSSFDPQPGEGRYQMKRQQSTHPLQAGPGTHVERENKGKTKNIYKKSVLVVSTTGGSHTGLHSSPIPPWGEMPFHATDMSEQRCQMYSYRISTIILPPVRQSVTVSY